MGFIDHTTSAEGCGVTRDGAVDEFGIGDAEGTGCVVVEGGSAAVADFVVVVEGAIDDSGVTGSVARCVVEDASSHLVWEMIGADAGFAALRDKESIEGGGFGGVFESDDVV